MVVKKERDSPKPVPSEVPEVNKQVRSRDKKPSEKSEVKSNNEEKKGLDRKEIESLIVKLNNEGLSQSSIGTYFKEKHNIRSIKKIIGKTVLEVLRDNKLNPEIPEDLTFLLKKAVSLIKHQKANKKDMSAKRGYQITVSKIRALARYYKKKGILPKDWIYDETKAALLVK